MAVACPEREMEDPIGAGRSDRVGARRLDHVANNVRFLVLPWVKVPNLASVILSESLCLLQRDWFQRYGVPVWLVESFVDRQRFSGASYRAAKLAGHRLHARFCQAT